MKNTELEIIKSTLLNVIQELKKQSLNIDFFNKHVETLEIFKVTKNNIILVTQNNFSKQVIKKDYLYQIISLINKKNESNFDIKLITENEKKIYTVEYIDSPENNKVVLSQNINKNYTFGNMIVGTFNNPAFLAGNSISTDKFINPLFICANVGLGKTHLMHAIGNEFIQTFPNKTARYISSDDFSREVYAALNDDNKLVIEDLKTKFENYDLLLIDDVQILANRPKINEILFSIFNNNISKGKYIVWASDKNPDFINGFEDRMKSRFHSGIFVCINNPDASAIKNIIQKKIQTNDQKYTLNMDGINFIARRSSGDVRRLEGEINQILFYAMNSLPPGSIIDDQIVRHILAPTNQQEINSFGFDVDPNIVISKVCLSYGVKEDAVKSKSRVKSLNIIRAVCMYVLRQKYNMTFSQIGQLFSGRNHSTVMDAIEKVDKILKKDPDLQAVIENIYKKI